MNHVVTLVVSIIKLLTTSPWPSEVGFREYPQLEPIRNVTSQLKEESSQTLNLQTLQTLNLKS